MSKRQTNRRQRKSRRPARPDENGGPREERAVEAITVAWTASVTSVVVADLATIAANYYAKRHPESTAAPAFEAIMLLTACALGLASLALLGVTWRVSSLKPPLGFIAFAILVAAAPILTTVARLTAP